MPRHPIFSARIQFQAEPERVQAALRYMRPDESPAEFWRRVLDEWVEGNWMSGWRGGSDESKAL